MHDVGLFVHMVDPPFLGSSSKCQTILESTDKASYLASTDFAFSIGNLALQLPDIG